MKKTILSWSGGKDSVMALHALKQSGHDVVALLTTVSIDHQKTYGHDEKTELIDAQAKALTVPVYYVSTSWEDYSWDFVKTLQILKKELNATDIAFGDLYVEGHKEWSGRVSKETDLTANYPIWIKENQTHDAYDRFLASGYKAKIIRVQKEKPPLHKWLGKDLDEAFLAPLSATDSCVMGENGEYHTFVYDGPLFQSQIPLTIGPIVETENTYRLELSLGTTK